MVEKIKSKFEHDLERVDDLIGIYDETTPQGRGRRAVTEQDILRAAVAFLHASLEDLLRNLLLERLPRASVETWKEEAADVPLPGKREGSTFQLHHLAYHTGSTVDDLLREAVDSFLERSNFNNVAEIKQALRQMELDSSLIDEYRANIGPLTARRHQIVHRLDANRTQQGSGHHVAKSLSQRTVETWKDAVQDFGGDIFGAIDEEGS